MGRSDSTFRRQAPGGSMATVRPRQPAPRWVAGAAFAIALGAALQAHAAQPADTGAPPARSEAPESPDASALTYADLADLADRATIVVRAKPRGTARVEPERAPGLAPGETRLFVKARAVALLAGPALSGQALQYLIDVPLDARGKPPRQPKGDVILFARPVEGRPGTLQLVDPHAQIAWTPEIDTRLRAILQDLLAADAPPRIVGVREAIFVPGNLAGEGETQLFLATEDGQPASITVSHRPGESPRWSVSFSEVLDAAAATPERDSLPWYRLACFLPRQLKPGIDVSSSPADRAQARADFARVRADLGDCPRTRG